MTLLPEGKLYIDGKLREAKGGATFEDFNPWTGELIAHAADGSAEDMEEAAVDHVVEYFGKVFQG